MISITLRSTSIYIENNSEVLVVLKVIEKYNEVLQVFQVLIIGYKSSFFSHLEYLAKTMLQTLFSLYLYNQ